MTTQTEKRAGHTAVPWVIRSGMTNPQIEARGQRKQICATLDHAAEDKANADFIVHAVNNHADLLAALERFLTLDDFGHEMTQAEYEQKKETAIQQARSAIARAKGDA